MQTKIKISGKLWVQLLVDYLATANDTLNTKDLYKVLAKDEDGKIALIQKIPAKNPFVA